MNITIIGCGHGGQALAAYYTQLGYKVTLYADDAHPGAIHDISENRITLEGKLNSSVIIHCLTTDIDVALREAKFIFISLPSHAHLSQFKKMLPFLRDEQVVVTLAGNFSSLYFYHELRKIGKQNDVYLADVASLPYACRSNSPGKVQIIEVKKTVDIAAMPGKNTENIAALLSVHFPTKLTTCANVIELGMNIISAIIHPVITLTNAGRIGPDERDFYFYREGISADTVRIIEQMDTDRQRIAQKYGFVPRKFLDTIAAFYTTKYDSIYTFFLHSSVHNTCKLCPRTVQERYITQDVPYVIVPWLSLGAKAGYTSDVMHSVVVMASTLNSDDYYSGGRNLIEDLFPEKTIDEIVDAVSHGF